MRAKQVLKAVLLSTFIALPLTVCGSNSNSNLGVTAGPADSHCVGVTPQEANVCVCDARQTGSYNPCTSVDSNQSSDMTSLDANSMDSNSMDSNSTDANSMDANSMDSNGMTSDYGPTMYGAEGDDDDCKYHVNWSVNSTIKNTPVTFKVSATRLVENQPLTGAAARAEVYLPGVGYAPATNPAQSVVENPPGTYTISPVVFNASGVWTVRFHFYELCSDTQDNSEHGHAAFNVTIP